MWPILEHCKTNRVRKRSCSESNASYLVALLSTTTTVSATTSSTLSWWVGAVLGDVSGGTALKSVNNFEESIPGEVKTYSVADLLLWSLWAITAQMAWV